MVRHASTKYARYNFNGSLLSRTKEAGMSLKDATDAYTLPRFKWKCLSVILVMLLRHFALNVQSSKIYERVDLPPTLSSALFRLCIHYVRRGRPRDCVNSRCKLNTSLPLVVLSRRFTVTSYSYTLSTSTSRCNY